MIAVVGISAVLLILIYIIMMVIKFNNQERNIEEIQGIDDVKQEYDNFKKQRIL